MILFIKNYILLTKLLILGLTITILFNINQTNTSALEDPNLEVIQPNQTNTSALEDPNLEVIQPDKPELKVEISLISTAITFGQKQVITITVLDSLSDENLAGVIIDGNVTFQNKTIILGKGETNKKGKIFYTIPISSKIKPGLSTISIDTFYNGYNNQTIEQQFQVLGYDSLFAARFHQVELKDKPQNKNIIPVTLFIKAKNESNQTISIDNLTSSFFIDDKLASDKLMPKINDETSVISPKDETILPLNLTLAKSDLHKYVYDALSTNPFLSTYLKYELKGNMIVTYENANITVPYNGKAESLKYKNNIWDIREIKYD